MASKDGSESQGDKGDWMEDRQQTGMYDDCEAETAQVDKGPEVKWERAVSTRLNKQELQRTLDYTLVDMSI